MLSAAFLSLLTLLALSNTGSPAEVPNSPITLPMTRRLKSSNSTNLVQHDEARAAAFRDNIRRGQPTNVFLESDFFADIVSVDIGIPPTTYDLIVDTGSAVTWVGANHHYVATHTSVNTRQPVAVTYSSASFDGILYNDTVALNGSQAIEMPIGVASVSHGINFDGILGIGPAGLTIGTLKNSPKDTFPTVTDFLHAKGAISQPLVGIFFQLSTLEGESSGELSFGETNPAMYIGDITYTPITTTAPASNYWGIDQSITYGPTGTMILSSTAGIIDSGFTFISIASDAYDRYRVATGGTLDTATNLLTITPGKYGALHNLDFHIGKETYSLTPNAQIWPRSINAAINGADNAIYLVVKSLGTPTGQGIDFHNGYVFLQRFYTVLDTSNSRVGFAKTSFTDATTN
ncbi:aspartic peptidase domain-containing protein [Suillus spraguei]|nr:aspartic peptidase domain-containing protein [Suillus spraguei]